MHIVENHTHRNGESFIEYRVREISGKRFAFTRAFWSKGEVVVLAVDPNGKVRHRWEGKPEPLECGHVPSYGCDCYTIAAEAASS